MSTASFEVPVAPFPCTKVERVAFDDPNILDYLKREEPLILTNATFVKTLTGKWTVDYLKEHMDSKFPFTVFVSNSSFFRYWNEKKHTGRYVFEPPTSQTELTLPDFVSRIRASAAASGPAAAEDPSARLRGLSLSDPAAAGAAGAAASGGDGGEAGGCGEKRYYLQQSLVTGMGDRILDDFRTVDWRSIHAWKAALGFGELTTNLLLIGQPGHTTPAHYDEQQNFFCQLDGHKAVWLVSPEQWTRMYPYPVHHACDRQSMVDIFQRAWPTGGAGGEDGEGLRRLGHDAGRFPRLAGLRAVEAVVAPGELLYIPAYWWHHVLNLDEAVSLIFWFKCGPNAGPVTPLKVCQLVSLRRNLEGLLGDRLGPARVRDLMLAIEAGAALTPEQTAVMAEFRPLLKQLLGREEDVDPFLQDLVHGRFNLPVHPDP